MWGLFVYICVCACMVAANPPEPHCVFQKGQCIYVNYGFYIVEGKDVYIEIEYENHLKLKCGVRGSLDYNSMPRFADTVQVSTVKLINCPAPRGNTSYADVLAIINVTLQPEGHLILENLPQQPKLSKNHFTGLENLASLEFIFPWDITESKRHNPAAGFLYPLRNLRKLVLKKLNIASSDLELPTSLEILSLTDTNIRTLPESVQLLPKLKVLYVSSRRIEAFASERDPNSDKLVMNVNPTLENVTLYKWAEQYPAEFVHCDALLSFRAIFTKVRSLPERWVAACPQLKSLRLSLKGSITTLPVKLLEGAGSIVDLSITHSKLETLPEELLEPVPNLITLNLSNNRLLTLPSGIFSKSSTLQSLSLSYNKLTDVQDALSQVTTLVELDLSHNSKLQDFCDVNGISRLNNVQILKSLNVVSTAVTHICRDWRYSKMIVQGI